MKPIFAIGLLAKKETTYNTLNIPSASTDAVLLDEQAKMTASYANDGGRPAPPGILGYQRRVPPTGRTWALPVKHSAKGAATAYSAAIFPSPHVLLQAAGFDAAVTVTGGSEKWAYTPTPVTTVPANSASVYAYARGQLYPITGVYSDLSITADGPVVPSWEFALQGVGGVAISDITLPAITYPTLTTDPPKATAITFTIGNLTGAIVRKFALKMNRTIAPALDINSASGHGGFRPSRRTPTLEVTFEATALTTTPFTTSTLIDPYQLYEAGTNVACSLAIGSVQYNRFNIVAGGAQIMKPPVDDDDGPTALITLSLQLNPTTLNANDDVTINFN